MSNLTKSKTHKIEDKKRKPLFIKSKVNLEQVQSLNQTNKSTSNEEQSNSDLLDSLDSQLSKIEFLNAKYLPLQAIHLDPDNPRKLSIDINDVLNGPKLPEEPFDDEVQDAFKETLKQHFGVEDNKKQKIQDYLSIALLASSIKVPERLIQPICVYGKGNKYILLAGERRTLAHHVMGAKFIAANIIIEPENKEKALLQYIENSSREDLSLKDKYGAIRKIISYYSESVSARSLASILRISKSQAQKYSKICKEENIIFKRAIETGVLTSPEDAYNIIKSNDSNMITNICNLLLKGKGIEEALQEINNQTSVRPNLKPKRIISPNPVHETKDEQKVLFKGDDINVLKELIHIAIKGGKLDLSIDDFKNKDIDFSSLWKKIKDIVAKAR
ncbi:ParB/RepB/Spo0J family partition protein [Candidatus Berkiella aquae]|uniref:Nucleoid occlusion protein n=1 Tax=Candidatus Berkiella aquae TaxID=295108 RepID=A0A0Q9YHY8_9GAMM|nr:ParB N-terminal domain-containing protein [Candidatus Berkiella aquae]MCS5712812.1 ParB N-terminal domain-containing protein [Candidatus Berkiella aquae]